MAYERLNFLVTNFIPRRLATQAMGWFSRIESPSVARAAIAVWTWFGADLRLHEAKQRTFGSLHACFIRELRDGARPIDPDPDALVSPCDAEVMAVGRIDGTTLVQAKGLTYALRDLLVDADLVQRHRYGVYVTLRLRADMYHRFHAPDDFAIDDVLYVTGDVWNVNPATVQRLPNLYCRNERAVIPGRLADGSHLTLVPVAAVLVASIHLHCLDVLLNLRYRGPNRIPCRAAFRKGEELGYFQHGSTVVVLASGDLVPADGVRSGAEVRVGQALIRRRARTPTPTP